MKVKLSLIIEGMDRANPDETYYLNEKLGRVLVSTESGNFYIDNVEKINDDNIECGEFICLPGQYEINEYDIIKKFINTITDEQIRNQLLITIKGSGAFRRFKDSCINYNIIDKWYAFKNKSYYELAKEWCEWNNIEFYDDVK